MIRYTLFIATILGTAATAIASVKPMAHMGVADLTATTIAYKNDADSAPLKNRLVLTKCAVEDCSDTPQ